MLSFFSLEREREQLLLILHYQKPWLMTKLESARHTVQDEDEISQW